MVHAGIGQQHTRAAGTRDDNDIFALRCWQDLQPAGELQHVVKVTGANDAALPEHGIVDGIVTRQGPRMRSGCPRPHSRAAGLQHDHRLALGHPLGDFGKRPAVLQVLDVHGHNLRVRVLLEKRQQVVLVDVRLVAKPNNRRYPHLGRAAEADDRHADTAALR